MSCKVHSTAIVETGAELGTEVEIGPYSVIGQGVKIGDACKIAAHVVISGKTSLGTESTVSPFASLGGPPQDLKYHGEPSELLIGSRNIIREYVTLQPGTGHGTMKTIIGDGNMFMANSHVAHDCRVGNRNVFANSVALAGHVEIRDCVMLGGMVGIHQFCRVGDLAIVSAGSMIASDVPPYCIGQGDRCHLRGINLIGLERAGLTEEEIKEIKRVYRALFSTVGHLEGKVAALPAQLKSRPLIEKMLNFIKESKRGICTPRKELNTPGV